MDTLGNNDDLIRLGDELMLFPSFSSRYLTKYIGE